MIAILEKQPQRTAPRRAREERGAITRKTLVVDRLDEAFDLAIGGRAARANEPMFDAGTVNCNTARIGRLIPLPSAQKYGPRDPVTLAQHRQRGARFVLGHELRSHHRIMSYASLAPPPCGSS